MDSTNNDVEITNETYLMQVNSHGFDNSEMESLVCLSMCSFIPKVSKTVMCMLRLIVTKCR